MKKVLSTLLLIAAMLPFVLIRPGTADCDTITGIWKFDLGGGFMAQVEYKNDGSFVQKMNNMEMKGSYVLKNKKITTDIQGMKSGFTILSCENNKLTVKRDKDGKTVVYIKQ